MSRYIKMIGVALVARRLASGRQPRHRRCPRPEQNWPRRPWLRCGSAAARPRGHGGGGRPRPRAFLDGCDTTLRQSMNMRGWSAPDEADQPSRRGDLAARALVGLRLSSGGGGDEPDGPRGRIGRRHQLAKANVGVNHIDRNLDGARAVEDGCRHQGVVFGEHARRIAPSSTPPTPPPSARTRSLQGTWRGCA